MDSKKDKLFKLAEGIRKCTACSLWKGRTLTVPGDGNLNAKLMFIGEAPGTEEDRQGVPFVGRAGKLLNKMLKAAGLDREEIFISNCLKCRPPGNRDPKLNELKTCKELWLDKQIAAIKPKLIVVLGRVALKNLLEESKVNNFHGKVLVKDKQKYFITYHPAAAIRFPKKIGSLMENDFLKLKKIK